MSQPDDVFDPEPEAPSRPPTALCCGSGCDNCVLDVYRLSSRITGSSIGSGRSGKRPLARPSATLPGSAPNEAGKLLLCPVCAMAKLVYIATPPLLMALCRLPS